MDRRLLCNALALPLYPVPSLCLAASRAPLRVGVMTRDPESWAAAQILAEVYKQAGLAHTFVTLPATRGIKDLVSGVVDADLMRIAALATIQPQLLRVPTQLYRIDAATASLTARNVAVQSREDLMRYTVGVVRGYFFAQELTERHHNVTLTQTTEQLCRMLRAERVDLALDTTLSLRYMLSRLGMSAQTTLSPPLLVMPLYHYLHPRHAALLKPIDDTLRAMTASGQLTQLTRQFDARAAELEPDQLF